MKLGTNIHNMSGHCRKVLKIKGHRSRSRPDQLTYIDGDTLTTMWRRG